MTEAQKKRKLSQHFEDLEKVYIDTRSGADFGKHGMKLLVAVCVTASQGKEDNDT